MEKVLSVIIPVYNVEKYLRRCVDSVINQTYDNLEIILVNDGSTDTSLEICREYKDKRIKVIDKANGGLSSARNAGLKVATGELVTFLDSDDFLEIDIYQKLTSVMQKEDVDIATMLMASAYEDGKRNLPNPPSNADLGVKSGEWFLEQICLRKFGTSVCSKVFNRSVFDGFTFDETRQNEDFLIMSEILVSNVKVYVTDYLGYNYFVRSGSMSRSGFSKSLRDAVYNTESLVNRLTDTTTTLYKSACCYAVYQARTAIAVMTKEQFKKERDFVLYCKKIIKKYNKYTKNSILTKNDRLFCKIFKFSPKLAKTFIDLVRK